MSLNEKAFALAAAVTTVVMDVIGYVWHGLLGQPSAVDLIHPGFWGNWTLMIAGLIGTVVLAYVLGYVFAWTYNRQSKK